MSNYLINIKNLDVRNFITSKVEDMSLMSYYCSGLTSLNLQNFDTSNVNIMEKMFKIKCIKFKWF